MRTLLKNIQTIHRSVVGLNERNLNLIYPNNRKKDYALADNKLLTKQVLEEHNLACPKTLAVINNISALNSAWQAIQHYPKMVIKPAKGSGGKGILVLKQVNQQWYKGTEKINAADICYHIANILMGIYSFGDSDVALVEEYVEAHPFFAAFTASGVPDIRIILLKGNPLMAMLRLPTEQSGGKANLHQGGLGIGIDMFNGKLTYVFNGKKYLTHHPDNGRQITGKTVPDWPALVHRATAIATHFPLQYLGVDLVIDKNKGPLCMEVNVRPGLAIQLANKQGIKPLLNKTKSEYDEPEAI
mgnify:CR=1 FL=1